MRRLSVLAVVLISDAVACSDRDDDGAATVAPAEPATSDVPAATDVSAVEAALSDAIAAAASAAAALDFGSGTGSITLGEETFEFCIVRALASAATS